MNEKIVVKICTGTLCYVMGGADLQLLEDHLPAEYADLVDISGSPCLDICDRGGSSKAPYVLVGEVMVSEATISKVLAEIRSQINEKEA